MPMCLIVSASDTAAYNTAKLITKILQNYCGITSSFVKDSTDFIQKFKYLSINLEETLVSYDVSAISNSIPVPVALQVKNFYLHHFCQCLQDPYRKIHQASRNAITNWISCFNKKFYKPLQGAAMGSPVSSVLANINI